MLNVHVMIIINLAPQVSASLPLCASCLFAIFSHSFVNPFVFASLLDACKYGVTSVLVNQTPPADGTRRLLQ